MPSGSQPDSPETVALKEKARNLGIQFAPRLGHDKVQELMDEHEKKHKMNPQANTIPTPANGKLFLSKKEFKKRRAQESKRNASKLVRVRITCMNPQKKNWTGEIISVGSSKVGTFKKFIPYNNDEPYHVPYIIYKYMKERQCRVGTTQRLPNGQEVNRYKLIPEFAIDVLDPLTKDELQELAQRQAMASGTQVN